MVLFRYDLRQNQLHLVCMIEDESYDANYLFHKLVYHNSTIWLIPYQAKKMYSYNIDNNELESYPLPDDVDRCGMQILERRDY